VSLRVNLFEQGEWGHPSSRHSCDGPTSRGALAPTTSLNSVRTELEPVCKGESGAARRVGDTRSPYRAEPNPLRIFTVY
jgi:hypothetical protein